MKSNNISASSSNLSIGSKIAKTFGVNDSFSPALGEHFDNGISLVVETLPAATHLMVLTANSIVCDKAIVAYPSFSPFGFAKSFLGIYTTFVDKYQASQINGLSPKYT